jgi:hypothetical protein
MESYSDLDDEPVDCSDDEDGDLEEQHQIHAQLPLAEEVKSNLTPHKLANISFLRRERCAWVFLLLVVGVIKAGVISQLQNNRKQEQLMIEPSRTEVVIQFLRGKQVSTKAELRVLGTAARCPYLQKKGYNEVYLFSGNRPSPRSKQNATFKS